MSLSFRQCSGATIVTRLNAVLCFDGADGPIPYPGVKPVPVRVLLSTVGGNMQVDLIDKVGVKVETLTVAKHYGIGLFDRHGIAFGFYAFKEQFPGLVLAAGETITIDATRVSQ